MLQIPEPNVPRNPRQPEDIAIPDSDETRRFCPTSLTDWLKLCQAAGVPHVPAHHVTTVNRADWLLFDTPGPHQERLNSAREAVQQAFRDDGPLLHADHMLRFDFCAPLEVKFRLGSGFPHWHPDMTRFILDDPRAFDILMEQPRESVPIYFRPWIKTLIHDGFPTEYRAFVRDGKLQGISNYYPQRPLPEDQKAIAEVERLTQILIDNAPAPFIWNMSHMGDEFFRNHDRSGVHFTADFILALPDSENGPDPESNTENGSPRMLFLEGGPPHELGAHPCCFKPGRIKGIALSDRN